MKLKKFWSVEGGLAGSAPPLDPPLVKSRLKICSHDAIVTAIFYRNKLVVLDSM